MVTAKHTVLGVGMLITGSLNTIMTTWQDKTYALNRHGEMAEYQHPWFQTFTMFIGELLCLIAFKVLQWHTTRNRKPELDERISPSDFPTWVFALPTICDLTASTVMNVGLIFTTASAYQMVRGAMVLFTAIFSVVFLRRRLYIQHYVGLCLVIMGIVIVGLSSVLYNSKGSAKNPLLGNSLVLGAQVIVATQFVVEERFLGKYNVPAMQAVGLEGAAGVLILLVALPALQFIKHNGQPIEDTFDAAFQIAHSAPLIIANLGSICSIAFFNFFGVSVTKHMSSVHRTTIDSTRTVLIWIVSMCLGWESFIWLQLAGFLVLGSGTFIYNEVIALPFMAVWRRLLPTAFFSREDSPRSQTAPAPRRQRDWKRRPYYAAPHPAEPDGPPFALLYALGHPCRPHRVARLRHRGAHSFPQGPADSIANLIM